MVSPAAVTGTLLKYFEERVEKESLESLRKEIPKKWEKHGDCIIVPAGSFKSDRWTDEALTTVCNIMKVSKIVRRTGSITPNDVFRRPQVELLYGSDSWVSKSENGIKYQYDVCKCMFSSGNISEKLRIASWNLEGQTVVDLYAGIGYFTLTYLVHAKAQLVYACEMNPDALDALRKNLEANHVADRCVVLPGNNVETCPVDCADHVNLGYIPSSEASWTVACKALRRLTGGVLHVHGNVDLKSANAWEEWGQVLQQRMMEILDSLYGSGWHASVTHISRVKSYGPCVDHLVADVLCKPQL